MGGRIAIGVIDKNGALKTIEGHTNPLPAVMKTEAFAKYGDLADLEHYLEFYEKDVSGEGFGPMANIPKGYGYVLFDLREKAVLSAQDYTTLHSLLAIEVTNAAGRDEGLADGKARLLTHRYDWNEDEQAMVAVAIEGFKNVEDLKATPGAIYMPGDGDLPFSQRYKIEYPAWKVTDVGRTPDDIAMIRDYLAERNLLSPTDAEGWDLEIEDMHKAKAYNDSLNDGSPAPSP